MYISLQQSLSEIHKVANKFVGPTSKKNKKRRGGANDDTKIRKAQSGKRDTRTGNKPLRAYSFIHAIQEQHSIVAHLQVERHFPAIVRERMGVSLALGLVIMLCSSTT